MYDDEYVMDWDLPARARRPRVTFNEYTAAFDAGYRPGRDGDPAARMHVDDLSRAAEDASESSGADELGSEASGL